MHDDFRWTETVIFIEYRHLVVNPRTISFAGSCHYLPLAPTGCTRHSTYYVFAHISFNVSFLTLGHETKKERKLNSVSGDQHYVGFN